MPQSPDDGGCGCLTVPSKLTGCCIFSIRTWVLLIFSHTNKLISQNVKFFLYGCEDEYYFSQKCVSFCNNFNASVWFVAVTECRPCPCCTNQYAISCDYSIEVDPFSQINFVSLLCSVVLLVSLDDLWASLSTCCVWAALQSVQHVQ